MSFPFVNNLKSAKVFLLKFNSLANNLIHVHLIFPDKLFLLQNETTQEKVTQSLRAKAL
jgi:hypothetical protein